MSPALNRPVELVIFDWDGTLMDSEEVIVRCMLGAITDLGLEPRSHSEISNIIGLGLNEAVTTLYPGTDEEFAQQVADGYRTHFFGVSQGRDDLFPGVESLLDGLKRDGVMIAVATGKSRRGLDLVLEETGLDNVFHSTRCADETCSKPDPQMVNEILHELQIDKEAAMMVGDTEYDLAMAQRAGILSVGVCYGVHSAERLQRHNPVACVESIADIREIVPLAALACVPDE